MEIAAYPYANLAANVLDRNLYQYFLGKATFHNKLRRTQYQTDGDDKEPKDENLKTTPDHVRQEDILTSLSSERSF